MRKRIFCAALLLCAVTGLCGCSYEDDFTVSYIEDTDAPAESKTETETPAASEAEITESSAPETEAPAASQTDAPTEAPEETESDIVWGESYTTPEDVAEYLHIYGELPENFITKNEAKDMGWESSEGNLWEVAPGMSIGGDYFGNYEGLLPEGEYRECDVNFDGGYRGAERIIFGEDGSIYYTDDHYESFTQLY